MKKFFFICNVLLVFGCQPSKNEVFPEVIRINEKSNTEFLATLESPINSLKNNIYAPTLLMAWHEIEEHLNDSLYQFNHRELSLVHRVKSYQNSLNPDEFSTDVQIVGNEILASAYFRLSLPFETKLNNMQGLRFNDSAVSSFGFYGHSGMAKILFYNSDNDFALALQPKNTEHQIILIKSKKVFQKNLEASYVWLEDEVITFKNQRTEENDWKYYFNDEDVVKIPKIRFNLEYDFPHLIGANFMAGESEFEVTQFTQRNALVLNEKGAEVESYSEVAAEETAEPFVPQKILKFDSPFLLILSKKNQSNPYFVGLIRNTYLMGE